MSLKSEIRAFVDAHEGHEPEVLAEMFMRMCRKVDLLPLLVEELKWIVRNNVRVNEIEALRQSTSTPRTAESIRMGLGELARLLDESYRIGDGTARRFGELTADEHRTRVLMLRANINGLQRDIALHEDAVAMIEQHGVSCLDDLRSAEKRAA